MSESDQVDVWGNKQQHALVAAVVRVLKWMGMHALLIYVVAACNVVPLILQGFYWANPQNNIVLSATILLPTYLLACLVHISNLIPLLIICLCLCLPSANNIPANSTK